jgi:class 3 adenylate cyclase/tetratricopeptide (TPR) repeat protein
MTGARESSPPPWDGGEPGEASERRCRVTIMFADLSDYTSLNENNDPEDVAQLRGRLMQLVSDIVASHQGLLNQFVGDGVVAVFGLPKAHEDDGRRAISAAVELQERLRTSNWGMGPPNLRLRMHIGVHAGLVFAARGNPLHGHYQLTGDAVNTASRLCSAAKRDEVIVSDAALRGLEAFFDSEPVEPLLLKGKSEPVAAFRVLGSLTVESRLLARSRQGLTPFVGRQSELDRLERLLSDARQARGSVLCVLGDAGLGKTRLLDEFALCASRANVSVLRGWCESYGGISPLRPFLQIVRELLPVTKDTPIEMRIAQLERNLESFGESLRVHLPAFLHLLSIRDWDDQKDTETRQRAIISAVSELLLAVVRCRPQVLMFDDWQWSDGASLQVLAQLVRAARDKTLLLVIGARSIGLDDQVLAQSPTMRLNPFTESESAEVARLLVAADTRSTTLRSVHERSGGNPLFLEELCASMKLGLGHLEELDRGVVPTTVHALIRTRIESLPPELAELLGVASVIGNEFPLWLLLEVAASPDAEARVEELLRTGLLHLTDVAKTVRFKHGLTREVVYDGVRMVERRESHKRAAEALERRFQDSGLSDHFEVLAEHYARANQPGTASRYADLAGDKAATSSALDGARHHYAAALRQIDELSMDETSRRRWLNIVTKWSAACVYYPAREQPAVLSRAVRYAEELKDAQALARAEYWSGWIYYTLGAQEAAIEHSARALELSERANNARMTAQLLVNIGQSHAAVGDYDAAFAFLERGITMQRRSGSLGIGGAYALGCRAVAHGDRGEFGAAHVQMYEALSVVDGTGHPLEGSLCGLLGMIQVWQGNWHDARTTAARGRATGERCNGHYVLAMCEASSSYATWRLEGSLTALDALENCVKWLERRDINLYLSFCLGHLAEAEFEAGRVESAAQHAQRALARAASGDRVGCAMGHRVLALIAARSGSELDARQHCEHALRSAEQRQSVRDEALTKLCLGRLELGWGRAEAARALFEVARARFEELRMTWHRGETERRLATLLGGRPLFEGVVAQNHRIHRLFEPRLREQRDDRADDHAESHVLTRAGVGCLFLGRRPAGAYGVARRQVAEQEFPGVFLTVVFCDRGSETEVHADHLAFFDGATLEHRSARDHRGHRRFNH